MKGDPVAPAASLHRPGQRHLQHQRAIRPGRALLDIEAMLQPMGAVDVPLLKTAGAPVDQPVIPGQDMGIAGLSDRPLAAPTFQPEAGLPARI